MNRVLHRSARLQPRPASAISTSIRSTGVLAECVEDMPTGGGRARGVALRLDVPADVRRHARQAQDEAGAREPAAQRDRGVAARRRGPRARGRARRMGGDRASPTTAPGIAGRRSRGGLHARSSPPRSTGTGLGLAIAREFVGAHGGDLHSPTAPTARRHVRPAPSRVAWPTLDPSYAACDGPAMQFGIFYEHQLPRPWSDDDEQRLFQEALEQVELADRLGIDYAWEVEHHFLEEYSHSSAPEVFLAACAPAHASASASATASCSCRRATTIRRGSPSASRRSTWSPTAGSSSAPASRASRMELEGFGIDSRREARRCGTRRSRRSRSMLRDGPLPGLRGQVLLDAAAQRGPEAGAEAASAAVGRVLATATRSTSPRSSAWARSPSRSSIPAEAKHWVDDYYETFKRECTPIGARGEPEHRDGDRLHRATRRSEARAARGSRASSSSATRSRTTTSSAPTCPGRTNIWERFQEAPPMPDAAATRRHRHARRGARDARRRSRTSASTR